MKKKLSHSYSLVLIDINTFIEEEYPRGSECIFMQVNHICILYSCTAEPRDMEKTIYKLGCMSYRDETLS